MDGKNKQITQHEKKRHERLPWLLAALMVLVGLGPVNAQAESPGNAPMTSAADAFQNPECFHNHLAEAEKLNRERRPRYAHLTDGQSRAVSDRMIESEATALLTSALIPTLDFDALALPYLEAGVNVVCGDFVSMSEAPPFRRHFKWGAPKMSEFVQPDARDLERRLRREFRRGGFEGLHNEVAFEIALLDLEPRFNCLLHHVLSSMAHISALAPQYDQQALALGLPSPDYISTELVYSHMAVLGDTIQIDKLAAAIQAQDVPILCQDVPPIDINPVAVP